MKGTRNFSSFKTRQPSHLYISNLNRTEMSQNELPLHLRSWIFILCFKYLNKKQYLIFACESKKVNVKGYFKEKIFEKYIQCECQQPCQHAAWYSGAALLLFLCTWAHLFLYVLLICSKDNVTTKSSGSIQLRWIAVFLGFSVAPLGAFWQL